MNPKIKLFVFSTTAAKLTAKRRELPDDYNERKFMTTKRLPIVTQRHRYFAQNVKRISQMNKKKQKETKKNCNQIIIN